MSNLNNYIADLPEELRQKAEKGAELKTLLNANPPSKWLAKHPLSGHIYLPIDKVELLLDILFLEWTFNVNQLRESDDQQSVIALITLTVTGYDGTVRQMQGVGAVPIQRGKDTGLILPDARQKSYPAAISFAIKDAAEHLGKVFGRDVNRKDTISWEEMAKKIKPKQEDLNEIKEKLVNL